MGYYTDPIEQSDQANAQQIPKHMLVSGPWDDDLEKYPKIVYRFMYNNYDCAIRRNPFWAWCGYIKIPETHPYYNKNVGEMDIDVHGGFTGGDNEGRIGFDTCHYGDIYPRIYANDLLGGAGHYWTYDDTINEVKRAVDQLINKEKN